MFVRSRLLAYCAIPSVAFCVASLSPTSAAADCSFTPPLTTQTKCVKAVQIPGNPLRSFDISWVNPKRAEMYFADRSNAGVQVIDTKTLTWKRTLGGFVGAKTTSKTVGTTTTISINNNISGPDGVVSHGRWLYAGDGDSTLKVFDLDAPPASALKASISTGGTT